MRIENDIKLDFSDVLIRPKRSTLSSRSEVELYRHFIFKHSQDKFVGIPIIAANMDGVGTFEMANELAKHGMMTALTKHYTYPDIVKRFHENDLAPYAMVSIGTSDSDIEKLQSLVRSVALIKESFKYICLDVANGYTEKFVDTVKMLREKYPSKTIIAGNVVTAEMTEELILSGADVVKVGIGPGSVCTTRIKTGVGYPQLSAIIECADAAHGLGGHIIADGGCTSPGDIAKAFGAGADFVMLGGMLAGHDEGGGEVVDGKIQFYGMSSETAMEKHYGEKANYRASEGRLVSIKYRGRVENTVLDILGGLRSSCTYVGADKLKNLSKCTTFIRVNNTHNRVFEQNTIK